jgi:hypothetical protein
MPKKFAAFSLIMFAIVLMLAHAVIPHHHHEDHVCFEQHSCGHDQAPGGDPETGGVPEQQDGDCCMLANLQLFNHSAGREGLDCPSSATGRDQFRPDVSAIYDILPPWAPLMWERPFRQTPPDTPEWKPCHAGFASALRAPPLA